MASQSVRLTLASSAIMPRGQHSKSLLVDDEDNVLVGHKATAACAVPCRKRKATQPPCADASLQNSSLPASNSLHSLVPHQTRHQQQQQRLLQLQVQLKQQQQLLILQQQQLAASQRRNKDLLNIIYALVAAAAKQRSVATAAAATTKNSDSSSKQSTPSTINLPDVSAGQKTALKHTTQRNLQDLLKPKPENPLTPAAADKAPSSASDDLIFASALAAAVSGSAAAAGPATAAANAQDEQHLLKMLATASGEEDLRHVFEEALQPIKQQQQQQQQQSPTAAVAAQQQGQQQQSIIKTAKVQFNDRFQAPPTAAGAAATGVADVYMSPYVTQQQQERQLLPAHESCSLQSLSHTAGSPNPSGTTAAANNAAAGSSPLGRDGSSSSFCRFPSIPAGMAAAAAAGGGGGLYSGSAGGMSNVPSCSDLLSLLEEFGDSMDW